jgi:hypothetical protein
MHRLGNPGAVGWAALRVLAGTTRAEPVTCNFTPIADTTSLSSFFSFFPFLPSLNDAGTVAFGASPNAGWRPPRRENR